MRRALVLLALAACGGSAEDEEPECTPELGATWYIDADGDTWGSSDRFVTVCDGSQPLDHVLNADDCDDSRAVTFPAAPERCDGEDNDCDGEIDEALPYFSWFDDADGDGWGDGEAVSACTAPDGRVRESGDCDDGNATIHPTADEVCDGFDNDCDGLADDFDPNLSPLGSQSFHPDSDGDGFGDSFSVLYACTQPSGTVTDSSDCNDLSDQVFPGNTEVCDEVDNDCDLLVDEFDPDLDPTSLGTFYFDGDGDGFGNLTQTVVGCGAFGNYVSNGEDCDDTTDLVGGPATTAWLEDGDGDGFGAGEPALTGCTRPNADWVGTWLGEDCDDTEFTVFPGAIEVCDGLDNNCVDGIDDEDPAIDAATTPVWFVDNDFDGFGGAGQLHCEDPGNTTSIGGDCNDGNPDISPLGTEVCNGGLDDDCNGFADDADPNLEAAGLGFYVDLDFDGYGGTEPVVACAVSPGVADNPDDCDDTDPSVIASTLWWSDIDGDGFGAGTTVGPACESPLLNGAPVDLGEDCDDSLGFIFPGASDLCDDGIDQDCDGMDRPCPRSDCATLLVDGLSTGDGVYTIDPTGMGNRDVWCDMTTDGGGWTLVSSSAFPPDDAADTYSANLSTLDPAVPMSGIWDGLRDVIPGDSDIRFACKPLPGEDFTVDLVFYDIHWYREITGGTDAEVCFNEDDGLGYDQPAPARKNLLTGQERERGNDWDEGYLEGEDLCDSTDDFTVDFDNRGMDSNQFDGTDWGEDDGLVKCGLTNVGASWFVFVR